MHNFISAFFVGHIRTSKSAASWGEKSWHRCSGEIPQHPSRYFLYPSRGQVFQPYLELRQRLQMVHQSVGTEETQKCVENGKDS